MDKVIKVCDLCHQERDLVKYDGYELCSPCQKVFADMYQQAIKDVEFKVQFTVKHRVMLMNFLQHFNFHYLFKEKAAEMKLEFEKALHESRNETTTL